MLIVPSLSSTEGAAVITGSVGGGEAVPRRAPGGVRLGRPLRLQGLFPKARERRKERPEDAHPPATTSRVRRERLRILTKGVRSRGVEGL
jgi:hypothetical protein